MPEIKTSKLAINGGEKTRKTKFPPYLPIGEEEFENVNEVFKSNTFSRFLGCWHEDFFGGEQVQALEKEWAEFFKVKHAIAVNSATSALYCAVGAIGTEPFDEIIVSPYTMSASATAPLIYNAIPVFADVEPDCFCLDVKDIEKKITDRTKAIIVVDILGQPYDAEKINVLAKKNNLKVIEDCAQAPFAKYNGKFAGTLGDIGIYSLNYHKHIHSGEGGILVTNDDELANKLRLIRNHAEAVVEAKGETDFVNMIGFNYRMTEVEAAIARAQLKKLPKLVEERQKNIAYLEKELSKIPCLKMPKVRESSTNVYYQHGILFDEKIAGVHRDKFTEALKAELMPITLRETEGIKVGCGYVKPLYLQPIFQKKIAYGSKGFPWNMAGREYDYSKGICPVVEDLHFNRLLTHEY
ncbi:MAG TPA: DegT/DnrJ/EryC1/StrS family aminotransferase, partial [Candidatus Gastranaerophilaceae bacterium]|nr:DegT/DnrJ/EryC1/StrS family aminotransferase [Candidatus Gastranaerophilaceae bacterium]